MRYEYSITIMYRDGTTKIVNFFTVARAEAFQKAMSDFKDELNILSVGKVVELHPTNHYYSPYVRARVTAYLADAE